MHYMRGEGMMKWKEIFSIPNIISYVRIALMPVYVYSSLTSRSREDYIFSSFLLLFIAMTDFLDGFIARKFNMVTEIGKLMDPVADKLFQLAIAVCLVYKIDGMWIIFIIFLVKESVLGFCSTYFWFRYHRKMDGAMWCGKVSTAVFYAMTFLMVLLPPLPDFVYHLMEVAMAVTLSVSFVRYNQFFIDLSKEIKASKTKKDCQ